MKHGGDRAEIAVATTMFAAFSLFVTLTSSGFLEADGCTHYTYSRFAFEQPHYLVNIWGRPFCTALYAIPAQLGGLIGVRITSLLLAIALACVTWAIARQLNFQHSALAFIFTLAQPLVFLHSFAELTELPFALLLALAFLTYVKRRWMFFAILASLLPLARPEGFGFIALGAVALIFARQWWLIAWLPAPLALWSYAGWSMYGELTYPWYLWLPRNWPYAEKSTYASGSIFHFVALLPAVVSPLIFPAVLIGAWRRFKLRPLLGDHLARCRALIAIIPLMILIGHSVLYATGRMASSGEIRYMLVVAPFWSLLAATGWEWIFARCNWPHTVRCAVIASALPVFANLYYQVLPLIDTDDWLRARLAADWVRSTPDAGAYPRVQAAHPGIYFFLDISNNDPDRASEWRNDLVTQPRPGVMLVWDWVYGMHNADRARVISVEEILAAGWVPVRVPRIEDGWSDRPSTWRAFLSPRDVNGRHTQTTP